MPKILLLADDSVVIQKLVGLSFANEDVRLVTTDNGDDALARARELRPDLVLADIVMPGMSGYEVCEAIKRDPELQETPVLLLTGTFEAFDEARARAAGSDGHITKPFEAQALVERVNDLLASAKPQPVTTTKPQSITTTKPQPTTTTTSASDAAFDFFDDVASEQIDGTRGDSTAPDRAPARPTSTASGTSDDVFAFGEVAPSPPPLEGSEFFSDPLDFGADPNAPAGDRTVALMPDPATRPDLEPAPTVTRLAFDGNEPSTAGVEAPAAQGWDPLSADERVTPHTPDPLAPNPASAIGAPALTTVIMSDDGSSRDDICVRADPAAPTAEPFVAELEPTPMNPTPRVPAADPLLADDLFGDPLDADQAGNWPAASGAPETADVFDFDEREAPYGGSESDPFAVSGPTDTLPPAAAGYDVSSSDLGEPLAQAPAVNLADPILRAELDPTPIATEAGAPASALPEPPMLDAVEPVPDGVDPILPEAEPLPEAPMIDPASAPEFNLQPAAVIAGPASNAGPDITPVMRARIHETLEKVAWEAFADLSDTIVKQVLQRVEAVAWEVIPQMTETLIKEEIRRMKGDDES